MTASEKETLHLIKKVQELDDLKFSFFMAVLHLCNSGNEDFDREIDEAMTAPGNIENINTIVLKYLDGRIYRNTATNEFLTEAEMLDQWTNVYGETADTTTEAWKAQYIKLGA